MRCPLVRQSCDLLLFCIDAIFLRSYQVEKGFRTSVELMQTPVMSLLSIFCRTDTVFIEDGEKERAVV